MTPYEPKHIPDNELLNHMKVIGEEFREVFRKLAEGEGTEKVDAPREEA